MDQPGIDQSLGNGNSGISLTAIQNFGPSLESDIQGAVRDLERDIERYGLPVEYSQKLATAEKILRSADLATLVDWMACRRKSNTAEQNVRALLCFLINGMIIDDQVITPNQHQTTTVLKSEPSWLFQIPRGEPEPLSLQLSDLIQFFQKIPDCEIRGGTAFLSRLTQVLTCEDCIGRELDTDCVRGVLSDCVAGNRGNELGKRTEILNYFSQLESRQLTFKCGNCVVDVQRTENVKRLLGGS